MTVKVSMKPNWSSSLLSGLEKGLVEIVVDIDHRSAILAPKQTSALVNDRKIKRISQFVYNIVYGSSRTPYARLRHFENNKNPQTKGYLAKAGESVARGDKLKYFKGKI